MIRKFKLLLSEKGESSKLSRMTSAINLIKTVITTLKLRTRGRFES